MKKQLLTLVVALGLIAVASQAALITVGSTVVDGKTFTLAYDDVSSSATGGSGTSADGLKWYSLRVYCSDSTVKMAAFDATFKTAAGKLSNINPEDPDDNSGSGTGFYPTAFNNNNSAIGDFGFDLLSDSQLNWSATAGSAINAYESDSLLSSGLGFSTAKSPTNITGVGSGFNLARVAFTAGNDITALINGVYNAQGTLTAGSGVNIAFNTGGANKMANIPVTIPEPMTLALVAFGGLAMLRRRK